MNQFDKLNVIVKEKISVADLMNSPLKFTQINEGVGLNNYITDKNIYRPQLALAGYVGLFNFNRVQVFGNTEMYYLRSLPKPKRIESFETIAKFPIPCIILTNNHVPDEQIIEIATKNNIALLQTKYDTTKAAYLLSEYLDDQFSYHATVHGSFVDVYGVGILFTGRSGIGKSEIALDLVERGHRLVADDIVMLNKKRETTIMGTGTSLVQHFMEIRGLGIIDVRQMFGIRSIRFQKRLEIIVNLEDWTDNAQYTRTGLEEVSTEIMGIEIMTLILPIFSGKNITVIAEVIALNYLLKTYGYNASKVFSDKLSEQIRKKAEQSIQDDRLISYFQGDIE